MARGYFFEGKAISIREPYASAVVFAGKDIENRSWRTHYRGPIAIHASSTVHPEDLDDQRRMLRGGERRSLEYWINRGRRAYGMDRIEELEPSQVIGMGMLVDCVEQSSSPWHEKGCFGFEILGIVPIEPIAFDGALNLWDCEFEYTPLIRQRRRR